MSDDIFRAVGAPVFVHVEQYFDADGRRSWTRDPLTVANPTLKDWNFAEQVEPFSAFQFIAQYLGNNLVTQRDPNPLISDELKAHSAGFDAWSFRRHPSESKKRRR